MTTTQSIRRTAAAALALALLAACNDGSTAPKQGSAAQMGQRLAAIADSMARSGDLASANGVAFAAQIVTAAGRVGSVDVTIDGTTTTFNAIGIQTSIGANAFCPPSSTVPCPDVALPPTIELLAWEGDRATRVLSFHTFGAGDDKKVLSLFQPVPGPMPLPLDADFGAFGLLFTRGSRVEWSAVSGTVSDAVTVGSTACTLPTRGGLGTVSGLEYDCKTGAFTFSAQTSMEEMTLDRSGGLPQFNEGAKHTVRVASASVPGVALTITRFPVLGVPLPLARGQ